jgi:anaerobic selenocysteine-containing dehydrogenase
VEPSFLHGRLWAEDPAERGAPAPLTVVSHELPVDELDEDYPIRLTTGRRLDSYNTGVQSGGFRSPLRSEPTLDLSPEDAEGSSLGDGDMVRVTSRRGSIVAPVHVEAGLRRGLAFMAIHSPDDVDVNRLTIEAFCPKSGTSEFKATAIRFEPVRAGVAADGAPMGGD